MRVQHLQLVPTLTKGYSYLPFQDFRLIQHTAIGNQSLKFQEGTQLAKPFPIEFNQHAGAKIQGKVTSQGQASSAVSYQKEVGKSSRVQELVHKLWSIFSRRGENIKISSIDISCEKHSNVNNKKFSKVETMIENIQSMTKKVEGLKKRYETLKSLRDQARDAIALWEGQGKTGEQVTKIKLVDEISNISIKSYESSMYLEVLKFIEAFMENTPDEPTDLSAV